MLRKPLLSLALLTFAAAPCVAQAHADSPALTLEQKAAGMRHLDGLFPLDWDAKAGKMYLEIPVSGPDSGKEFLYLDSLPYGIGSNDIGLDRGQLGRGRVVHFYRSGNKELLIERNLDYRSSSPDPAERLDVEQSFAQSVLWGFPVVAADDSRVLIDATGFFTHDAHGVAESIAAAHQGSYKLDDSRSAIAMENTKDFPLNTEVEAILTFTAEGPLHAPLVRSVTPDPHAVTVREHYSFIQLPGPGYQPRAFDPRAGYFDLSYRDYSAPLGQPLDIHLITRHRLEKKDPSAVLSQPVQPIVYYVDRGAPEPIRSALVEGASWWNQAFEAAGYKDAFQVKVLPEGADPMDIRYNMIQWVHRSTRGWSYGESVIDPRTGEIIKGQVTLGSLRARQDYMIAEALLSPYVEGKPIPPAMEQMVLARIRQLAAHEVGHTLGLAHNFVASSIQPGASVMDYPHPWITLDADGRPDISHAYTTGIGIWDKVSIDYGYRQFPAGTDQHAALDKILDDAQANGLYFITDEDSRPLGSAHPYSHLWDNGHDPATELTRLLTVRRAALNRFGENAIQVGEPMAELEDTLVPLYLLHRYQTEAAAKMIGGLNYRYALRGDNQMVTQAIPAADQQRALAAVLSTLDAKTLTLPPSLLQMLPPRPPGYPRTQESFPARTGLTFDPEGAVESAANLTLDLLFNGQRATRLAQSGVGSPQQLSLAGEIDQTLKATWYAPRLNGAEADTQITVEDATLLHLLALASDQSASQQARGVAILKVQSLKTWLKTKTSGDSDQAGAHRAAALATIDDFEKNPAKFAAPPALDAPPGQPIGEDNDE